MKCCFRTSGRFGILLWFTLLLFLAAPLSAQSPYQLNWRKEAAFTTAGAGSLGGGLWLQSRLHPLTPEQIAGLNVTDLLAPDRFATRLHSGSAAKASDYLFYTSVALPLALMISPSARSDAGTIAALAGETIFVSSGLTLLTKNLVHRSRPFVYNPDVPLAAKMTKDARNSFFSGHTSSTAALCFFTAKVYSDYHPDSRFKPLVWGLAATIPALTGYLRIAAGKHFLSDVLVGYGVGAAVGILTPHWHKRSG